MATRQYIGARYVPKLVGEWDNRISYEPLSIVIVNGENSYTSKKNVPIGVDITDTEYWVLTGNYSAQLNEVVRRLGVAEDDIDELELYSGIFKNVVKLGVDNAGVDCTEQLNEIFSKDGDNDSWYFFPKGTYYLKNPVRIYSNTHILMSPEAVISLTPDIDTHIGTFVFGDNGNQYFATAYNGVHNVTFEGGVFDCGCTGAKDNVCRVPLVLGHCKNIVIKNVKFQNNAGQHFIELNSSKNVIVDNCSFSNGYALTSGGTNYEAIQVDNCNSVGFPYFGYYDGYCCEDINIINCSFDNLIRGIGNHSVSDLNYAHRNIKIDNCSFNDIKDISIVIRNVDVIEIINCYINNSETQGIELDGCKNSNVSNNSINTTNGNGIFLYHYTLNGQDYSGKCGIICNNHIENCGQSGILLRAGNKNIVENNYIETCEQGVRAKTSENLINNNMIIDCAKVGVNVEASAFTGVVIKYNKVSNNIIKLNSTPSTFVAPIIMAVGRDNSAENNEGPLGTKGVVVQTDTALNSVNGLVMITNSNINVTTGTINLVDDITNYSGVIMCLGTGKTQEIIECRCWVSRSTYSLAEDNIEYYANGSTKNTINFNTNNPRELIIDGTVKQIRRIYGIIPNKMLKTI